MTTQRPAPYQFAKTSLLDRADQDGIAGAERSCISAEQLFVGIQASPAFTVATVVDVTSLIRHRRMLALDLDIAKHGQAHVQEQRDQIR